ncbi:hypothetical protein Q3G72_015315 [Acer saccharum]|nr:hypothetical protein Q3G72_015315 [Acer saccharum]
METLQVNSVHYQQDAPEKLPSSTNNSYYVQEISYVDSTVTIMDVNDTTCPLQSLLSLNLTNSKFFLSGGNDIAVVKCNEKINTTTRDRDQAVRPFDYWSYTKQVVGPIDCMSDDKVFVYVVSSMASMDMMPSTCRTSQTAPIMGYANQIQNTVMAILRTRRIVVDWQSPDGCIDCEEHGNFCGFNFTINSTVCFKQKDSLGPKVPILVIIGTSVGGTIFFTLVMLVIYKSRKPDKVLSSSSHVFLLTDLSLFGFHICSDRRRRLIATSAVANRHHHHFHSSQF